MQGDEIVGPFSKPAPNRREVNDLAVSTISVMQLNLSCQ